MENKFTLRLIETTDCRAVLDVYKPYVLSTAITFEYEIPALSEFSNRIESTSKEYPWLVCLYNDKIIGYTYATKHRYRDAYQWSPESAIYISEEVHRKGIARILYETLFSILRLQGYYNVYAGVVIPNEKSDGFHRALGFEEIGVFKKVGFKLGAWHDVRWFQLHLGMHIDNPSTPVPITEIKDSQEFNRIMEQASMKLNTVRT
ncbi:MAG: N-acetyltransferase [Bacteroidetes bacterium]|nr:N-acetyltransferase [Bacteroidota bacterium]